MSYTPSSACNGAVAGLPTKQVCSALLATSPSRLLLKIPNSGQAAWFGILVWLQVTGKSIQQNGIISLVMIEKIKTFVKHPYIQELRDVRVLGLLIFGIIVLMVSWSGVRVIERNYRLQQQIARQEEQTKLYELENANKKLENEYYNTDQYLELQARKQFGKAAPGETVLLVPEHVAMSHTVDSERAKKEAQKEKPNKPFYQKNFEAWMSFFFRRSES
jgi:cell division protein FtsB